MEDRGAGCRGWGECGGGSGRGARGARLAGRACCRACARRPRVRARPARASATSARPAASRDGEPRALLRPRRRGQAGVSGGVRLGVRGRGAESRGLCAGSRSPGRGAVGRAAADSRTPGPAVPGGGGPGGGGPNRAPGPRPARGAGCRSPWGARGLRRAPRQAEAADCPPVAPRPAAPRPPPTPSGSSASSNCTAWPPELGDQRARQPGVPCAAVGPCPAPRSAPGSAPASAARPGPSAGSRVRGRRGPRGRPSRSGSSWAMRNISACTPLSAAPNGSRPVAAYASTEPRQNTSQAGVTRSPRTCSGDMKPGRADQRAGAGETAVGDRLQGAGDAEVDDARAVDGDQDVGRLEVAVDEPGAVDVLERVGEPGRPRMRTERSGSGPWLVRRRRCWRRRPGDVAGGDPGHGGLGVGVQHRGRPLAADPPGGPHLLAEAGRRNSSCSASSSADELDGDRTAPVGAGQIHLPHAARAEPRQQPVRPDPLRIPGPSLSMAVPSFPAPRGHTADGGSSRMSVRRREPGPGRRPSRRRPTPCRRTAPAAVQMAVSSRSRADTYARPHDPSCPGSPLPGRPGPAPP